MKVQNRFFKGIWKFINTAFGLWLLSTVAVGGGAWVFQTWRDNVAKAHAEAETFERLNFEAAGRTSQFLAWSYRNLRDRGELKEGITRDVINDAIIRFGDFPRKGGGPYIQEMLNEYSHRNLLSIYAELQLINERKRLELDPKNEYDRADDVSDPKLKEALYRREVYRDAMVALLEPDWLLNHKHPSYEIFRDQFSKAFLSKDIQEFYFPYTDCFDC